MTRHSRPGNETARDRAISSTAASGPPVRDVRVAGSTSCSRLRCSSGPDLSTLPAPIRGIVQSAYGSSIADVFLVAAPFVLLAFLISIFLEEVVLQP
ncbi:hypothetical protein GCM10009616_02830 [Microlunatus lacustris]